VVVEDDDDLPALLHQRASATGFEAKLIEARVRPGVVLLTSEEAPHLGVIVALVSIGGNKGGLGAVLGGMRWKLGVVLGLVAAAGLVVAVVSFAGSDDAPPWKKLPAPPLSPRESPVLFWTGKEVIVAGGSDAEPCPPNAGCLVPKVPPLADGAAYNLRTNSWRPIADAPVPFSWSAPVVIGSTAYLWISGEPGRPEADSAFLAYRFEEDRWEELFLPTERAGDYTALKAGDRIVAFAYDDKNGRLLDHMYDPEEDVWTSMEPAPFSSGEGRDMIWDGEKLLLFDRWDEGRATRGATLDLDSGEWRVLEDPAAEHDRVTTEPSETLAGVITEDGARYFAHQGEIYDELEGATYEIPELGGDWSTVEVAAGIDLFTFLGVNWEEWSEPGESIGTLHAEAWLWSPRPE
jgi:hypothetical protein